MIARNISLAVELFCWLALFHFSCKVLIVGTDLSNPNKTRSDIYNIDTDTYEATNNTNHGRQVRTGLSSFQDCKLISMNQEKVIVYETNESPIGPIKFLVLKGHRAFQ